MLCWPAVDEVKEAAKRTLHNAYLYVHAVGEQTGFNQYDGCLEAMREIEAIPREMDGSHLCHYVDSETVRCRSCGNLMCMTCGECSGCCGHRKDALT